MYVKIAIPKIEEAPQGFSPYWTQAFFIGSISHSHQVNALTSTYMRLVEAALVEYRLGQSRLQEFWETHDSLRLSAMHRAISHFEACITNMHRALTCFTRLRRHVDLPSRLRAVLNAEKPTFIAAKVSDSLREMRNAVHHLEARVIDGDIQEGEPFVLSAHGLEVPHASEPNQTVKTIDRLKIGSQEILFSELSTWLIEMAQFAEKISAHDFQK